VIYIESSRGREPKGESKVFDIVSTALQNWPHGIVSSTV